MLRGWDVPIFAFQSPLGVRDHERVGDGRYPHGLNRQGLHRPEDKVHPQAQSVRPATTVLAFPINSIQFPSCRYSIDNVAFPSVTICNVNQIRSSFLAEIGVGSRREREYALAHLYTGEDDQPTGLRSQRLINFAI